jgi:diaminohydroxyphosphoribosylaminopyrimidine deaminase/5-amino-6-(5-phosphoribosylamino)uracil reductase
MSLDGRTAMASGESQWITGEAARHDVHKLRARSTAILTGIGTVLADDASLNARLDDSVEVLQPLRVVLDSQLQLPATARLLSLPGRTLVLTQGSDAAKADTLRQAGTEVLAVAMAGEHLDLHAVMELLAQQQVNEVLVEAGPTLCGALLQTGLVDELVVYMAPVLMGDAARGLMHLPGLEQMRDRVKLEIVELRAVGRDWRITARALAK